MGKQCQIFFFWGGGAPKSLQMSAHLGFCMECYATHYYDTDDLDEDGKPTRKPFPEEAFIDIAFDHGLASPDTADKTYRKALGKIKRELQKKDIL